MDCLQGLFFLDFEKSIAGEALAKALMQAQPWDVIASLGELILGVGKKLPRTRFDEVADGIWIAKSAHVAPSAWLTAPCIIDEGAELRQGAFLRGHVIVGKHAVVGNSTEIKNAILFDHVQVPHFNYIGDSILGAYVHFGAGALTSNVRLDKKNIIVRVNGEKIETGKRKFGAIVSDGAEIGCHTVLNPGTIIGRHARIYPQSSVRGVVPEGTVFCSEKDNFRQC